MEKPERVYRHLVHSWRLLIMRQASRPVRNHVREAIVSNWQQICFKIVSNSFVLTTREVVHCRCHMGQHRSSYIWHAAMVIVETEVVT